MNRKDVNYYFLIFLLSIQAFFFYQKLIYPQDTQPQNTKQSIQTPLKESIWDWVLKGGVTMIPLGIIASIIIGFSIERYIFFKRNGATVKHYFDNFIKKIDNLEELEKFINEDPSIVSRVLKIALKHRNKEISLIEKEIENQSIIELGKLEKGLNFLSNLGNLAPLLGFFGTVVGMRHSFIQFVEKLAPTAKDLAIGVEEALITTQAGLLIAIPTYLIYNFFIYWIDSISIELERCGNLLLNRLYEIKHGN